LDALRGRDFANDTVEASMNQHAILSKLPPATDQVPSVTSWN
jgi:hypothetical protein